MSHSHMNDQQAISILLSYKGQIAGGGSRSEFQQALDQLASSAAKGGSDATQGAAGEIDVTKPGLLGLLARAEALLRENATSTYDSYSVDGVADFDGDPDAKAWYQSNLSTANDLAAAIQALSVPLPPACDSSSPDDPGATSDRA